MQGRSPWALGLLSDELVELGIVESISQETVRRVLKRNKLRPDLRECRVIPPEQNAAFVAAMEDIPDLYERPDDEQYPVVGLSDKSNTRTGLSFPSFRGKAGEK